MIVKEGQIWPRIYEQINSPFPFLGLLMELDLAIWDDIFIQLVLFILLICMTRQQLGKDMAHWLKSVKLILTSNHSSYILFYVWSKINQSSVFYMEYISHEIKSNDQCEFHG